jgi:O-antigen/teichoic acid export membrane protein
MTDGAVARGRMHGLLTGSSLTARVLRSSALTVAGFGFSQGMRLLTNLALTRILFPEAFGLMSLVSVFLMGLVMFSDVGISPAILQSKRGDEPDFLNTAFTIQIIRGVLLFIVGCGLALPVAHFYGEDILAPMLMVASVQFIIMGFMPTRLETAKRHLLVGRITVLDMGVQLVGVFVAVGLALWTGSVWALVISGLIGSLLQVIVYSLYLPGPRNALRWERPAAGELIHFGKWIFLSTICGFFLGQGDRLILGKFLDLDAFGIYNIGFFLASFPLMLGHMVTGRVLIPIYRDRPPAASRENFMKLRRMRLLATAGLMVLMMTVGFLGVWLVDLMYDDRYLAAGGIVVLITCMQMPVLIVLTYDQAALAAGDSKRYFVLAAIKAALVLSGLLAGVVGFGLAGALIGQGIAMILAYPVVVWLARRLGVWDPLHDAIFAVVACTYAVLVIWLNWEAVEGLLGSVSV